MPFVKFPILLIVFLVIVGRGEVIPFLVIAFGLWFVAQFLAQASRYEQSTTTAADLSRLRTSVADELLQLDDDLRLVTNDDARTRFQKAAEYYTRAGHDLDRGVRRGDRRRVANTLYRARYELEAAAALLNGETIPGRGPRAARIGLIAEPVRTRHPACHRW